MSSLRALYVHTRLTWGFVVRHKEVTAAQPAYIIPPPTTVVGAFAYPLLRLLGINVYSGNTDTYGEHRLITPIMKHLLECTKVASASLAVESHLDKHIGLAIHQEIGKLVTAPYRSGGSWNDAKKTRLYTTEFYQRGITQAIAIQAVGATYGPGAVLELLWIFDAEALSKRLNVKLEELDRIAEKAVYGAVRIGSKEGLVAVDYEKTLYEENVVVLGAGSLIKTRFYIEKSCAEVYESHLVHEITLWGLSGRPTVYYVPSSFGSNNILVPLPMGSEPHFKLIEPCLAYKLSNGIIGVGR